MGSHLKTRRVQSDLQLKIGSDVLRIEVKTRKKPPQVLERWRHVLDIVAIRADHGDWRSYLLQRTFMNILAYAAEATPHHTT